MESLASLNSAAETLFMDSWEGYPSERNGIINFVDSNNLDNIVLCTGDFHTSLAFDITLNPYDGTLYNPSTGEGSTMVEMVVPSVTSPNFDEALGSAVGLIESFFPTFNPHLKLANYRDHGYCILDVKSDSLTIDYFYSENIKEINNTEYYGGSVSNKNGLNRWKFYFTPTEPKSDLPELAPVSIIENEAQIGFEILNVYPNPSSQYNFINFNYVEHKILYVDIYSLEGKFIERVVNERIAPRFHNLRIDLSYLAAGNYFYNFILDNTYSKSIAFNIVK